MFNTEDYKIFQDCLIEVDEVFVNMRGNKALTRHIGEVKSGTYWDTHLDKECEIPESIVGLYCMKFPNYLQHTDFRTATEEYAWVKCEKQEIMTTQYVPLSEENNNA